MCVTCAWEQHWPWRDRIGGWEPEIPKSHSINGEQLTGRLPLFLSIHEERQKLGTQSHIFQADSNCNNQNKTGAAGMHYDVRMNSKSRQNERKKNEECEIM